MYVIIACIVLLFTYGLNSLNASGRTPPPPPARRPTAPAARGPPPTVPPPVRGARRTAGWPTAAWSELEPARSEERHSLGPVRLLTTTAPPGDLPVPARPHPRPCSRPRRPRPRATRSGRCDTMRPSDSPPPRLLHDA